MKVKRAVGVDRDHDRDDQPRLVLRARVELLAELHDVDAVLTERRPDRRRGVRRAGGNWSFDVSLTTFFATCGIASVTAFSTLREIELHGRRPPEDADHRP